jgi:hypothetical protein
MMRPMRITARQLATIAGKEKEALRRGGARSTRAQAECWCFLHVSDDWYRLPLMLVAKGYNCDYDNSTEVGADSVYELDERRVLHRLAGVVERARVVEALKAVHSPRSTVRSGEARALRAGGKRAALTLRASLRQRGGRCAPGFSPA